MIGLGRMGANMAQRLMRGGHKVVGYDPRGSGARTARKEWRANRRLARADGRKTQGAARVWLMVPAGEITDGTITNLTPLLAAGDTIIDGGNSNYRDTQRRAAAVAQRADPLRRLRHQRRRMGPGGRL